MLLAALLADEAGVTPGGIAAAIALSNIVTAATAGAGVWYLNFRKQRQEFRKEEREQDRIDRSEALKEWERLVELYSRRITAIEERLVQCEEAERHCQRRLRKYENKLRQHGLWSDSDNFTEPPSPLPRPPEGRP